MRATLLAAATAACVSAALLAAPGASQAAPTSARPTATHGSARAVAVSRARAHADQHALGRAQSAVLRDVALHRGGASDVRFDRTYRGLTVVGGDFVIHQRANGAYRSTSGARVPSFRLSVQPGISARHAADLAAHRVGFRPSTARPELVVLLRQQRPVLAYRVNVEGRDRTGAPHGSYLFLDARSGRTLTRWASVLNDTGSGTGLFVGTVPLETTLSAGTYRMVDPLRGNNETHNGPFASSAPVFTDADNVWGGGAQTAAVDAHFGIAKTWDFYKNTFGRTGIANDGKGARSYVHDGAYVNASWSDSCFCMKYGDGDATTYPLVELDVAGHEMTHGVTSRTAGLRYAGESGGLNEATSDIMGTMVEFSANNAGDPGDYVIGEEIFRSYNPATNYIRRMDRPSLDGGSQDCWSRRTKSVDVHYSSGVANHFFYLLSEGSGAKTIGGVAYNSPTCNGSTVTGIGRDAAAAIWYRALTSYMTSTTNYAGARTATVSAATALYGATSTQVAAVKSAWSAVSVN